MLILKGGVLKNLLAGLEGLVWVTFFILMSNGNPLQHSCLGIPWIEEPGRLQSTGSKRVEHNLAKTTTSHLWGFSGDAVVKNLPAKQETWVQSPSLEDPLEKETATHSCILAWKIPWREEFGRLQSMGLHGVGYDLVTRQQQIPF